MKKILILTPTKVIQNFQNSFKTFKIHSKLSKFIQNFQNSRFSYLPIFKTFKIQEFPNLDFSNSNPLVTSSCNTFA